MYQNGTINRIEVLRLLASHVLCYNGSLAPCYTNDRANTIEGELYYIVRHHSLSVA